MLHGCAVVCLTLHAYSARFLDLSEASLPRYARSEQPTLIPLHVKQFRRAWDAPPYLGCDRTQ
jgi:hypothetical protein